MTTKDGQFAKRVAVIGGGRWARTIAGVLYQIAPSDTHVSLCSPTSPALWESWANNRAHLGGAPTAQVVQDLDRLFSRGPLDLTIVARAARDNAETALQALEVSQSILIEKPFAVTLGEAQEVVEAAGQTLCATGLVFLFASNLRRFARFAGELGDIKKIAICWHDPEGEQRYGEEKRYDASINCITDVFPHVWSLLRLLSKTAPLTAQNAFTATGGRRVELALGLGDSNVVVDIARDSTSRIRRVMVDGSNGSATLDFSEEPGTAAVNGRNVDIQTGFTSPLAGELNSIATGNTGPNASPLCLVRHAVESVALADDLLPSIRQQQFHQIISGLKERADKDERRAADYALRELASNRLSAKPFDSDKIQWFKRSQGDQASAIRDWLTGELSESNIPTPLRDDSVFRSLKQNALRSGSTE